MSSLCVKFQSSSTLPSDRFWYGFDKNKTKVFSLERLYPSSPEKSPSHKQILDPKKIGENFTQLCILHSSTGSMKIKLDFWLFKAYLFLLFLTKNGYFLRK